MSNSRDWNQYLKTVADNADVPPGATDTFLEKMKSMDIKDPDELAAVIQKEDEKKFLETKRQEQERFEEKKRQEELSRKNGKSDEDKTAENDTTMQIAATPFVMAGAMFGVSQMGQAVEATGDILNGQKAALTNPGQSLLTASNNGANLTSGFTNNSNILNVTGPNKLDPIFAAAPGEPGAPKAPGQSGPQMPKPSFMA